MPQTGTNKHILIYEMLSVVGELKQNHQCQVQLVK